MSTKIEWVKNQDGKQGMTWNPVTGCNDDRISIACANCYARRMANRLRGRFGYPEDEPFRVTLHPDRFIDPYNWQFARNSKRIFVCSMGDLFHRDVDYDWIDRVFRAIENGRPILGGTFNTYIFLTKRPHNALGWLNSGPSLALQCYRSNLKIDPYIWFGVTTENQRWFDERVPTMLNFPAGKHFISAEPLLGPLDLSPHIDKLDWVIVGAETGGRARPLKLEWVESIIKQCRSADVPVFVKKLGKAGKKCEWRPEDYREFPEVKL